MSSETAKSAQLEQKRTLFKIEDKTKDLEDYNSLVSFLNWTPEERVLRFLPFVQKISKLLCPHDLKVNLVQPGEIVIGSYKDLESWRKEEIVEKRVNMGSVYKFHFAEEGIKKSAEFCFHLILHHMFVVMQYRMLRGRWKSCSLFFGKGADWVRKEINNRLGLTDYKIYENIDENEKLIEHPNLKFKEEPLEESSFNYEIRKDHSRTNKVSFFYLVSVAHRANLKAYAYYSI